MATVKFKKMNLREKIFGAMFVVSMVFIMITISYSWFMEGDNASVSNVHMDVEKGSELFLMMGSEGSKVKELEFAIDKDFKLNAVAGNGKYFYNAILDEHGKVTEYTSISEENYAKNGVFTFFFEMYIEETTPVYMYAKSSGDPPIPSGVTGVDESPKSPYGDFSTKYISGAVRLAILQADENGEYHPTFIWAPDTESELRQEGTEIGIYEGTDGKVYEDYIYVTQTLIPDPEDPNTKVPKPVEVKINAGDSSGVLVGTISGEKEDASADGSSSDGATEGDNAEQETEAEDNVIYAWGPLSQKQIVGNLIGGEQNKFKLVIWVDGNDRECHNALLEGLIFVSLHFGV